MSGYTVDGSFQQYAIAKAAHVARIDKSIPLDAIAPVLCGECVFRHMRYHVLTRIQLELPSTKV